jgi:hypothetical protein
LRGYLPKKKESLLSECLSRERQNRRDEKRKCRIFKSDGGFGPSRLLCIAAVCLLSLTQWYQKNKNKEKKKKGEENVASRW